MDPEFACHSCMHGPGIFWRKSIKQWKKKKTALNLKPGTFFKGGWLEELAPADEVAPSAADVDATGSWPHRNVSCRNATSFLGVFSFKHFPTCEDSDSHTIRIRICIICTVTYTNDGIKNITVYIRHHMHTHTRSASLGFWTALTVVVIETDCHRNWFANFKPHSPRSTDKEKLKSSCTLPSGSDLQKICKHWLTIESNSWTVEIWDPSLMFTTRRSWQAALRLGVVEWIKVLQHTGKIWSVILQ